MKVRNLKGIAPVHNLALQFISVLTSRGLQKIINLIIMVILVRLVPVEDFGIYGLFVTTITMAAILGAMGMQEALGYLIGQKPEKAQHYISSATYVLVPSSIIASIAASIWMERSTSIEVMQWLAPAFITLFGKLFVLIAQGNSLGKGSVKDFNLSEALPLVISLVAFSLMYFIKPVPVLYIIWLYALSYFGVSIFYLYKTFSREIKLSKPVKEECISIVRWGVPYAISMFLATANNSVGLYMLREKGMDDAVGHYFVAWQIFNALLNIANALGIVLFSHSARSKDPYEALKDVSRFTSILLWFMLLVGGAAAIVSPWLIPIVFGHKYIDAVPLIQLIFCGMGFVSISRIIYRSISGLGLPYISTALLIPAILVNAATGWLLIDYMGQEGAIIGLILSQIFTMLCYLLILKMKFNVSAINFIVPRMSDILHAVTTTKRMADKLLKRG